MNITLFLFPSRPHQISTYSGPPKKKIEKKSRPTLIFFSGTLARRRKLTAIFSAARRTDYSASCIRTYVRSFLLSSFEVEKMFSSLLPSVVLRTATKLEFHLIRKLTSTSIHLYIRLATELENFRIIYKNVLSFCSSL